MGNPIVKLGERYVVWSTVVDAPITAGLTLQQLRDWISFEHGRRGLEELAQRLKRVEERGTSAYNDDSAAETIRLNRAGKRESRLACDVLVSWAQTGKSSDVLLEMQGEVDPLE